MELYKNKTLINLKNHSKELLKLEYDAKLSERIINEIYNYFKEVTLVSVENQEVNNLSAINASSGKALSINHAAQCFLDYKRTTKLLKGFVACIRDKQKKHPQKKINILYTGCGPFAPFFILVAPLFTSKEIQFTLLEINKSSLDKAKILTNALILTDYVESYILSDATSLHLNAPDQYDILFSETLDALLYRECYVPILWNLLPQLSKNISVIPENVKIDLYFKNSYKKVFSKNIFDVRERVKKSSLISSLPIQFKTVKVPLKDASEYDKLLFTTEVYVYKDLKLLNDESSISRGLEMDINKPIVHKTVYLTYHTSPNIELKLALEN